MHIHARRGTPAGRPKQDWVSLVPVMHFGRTNRVVRIKWALSAHTWLVAQVPWPAVQIGKDRCVSLPSFSELGRERIYHF